MTLDIIGTHMKQHHISLSHALDGVAMALKTQPNFKIHIFLSVISVVAGWFLHISPTEWLFITFAIAIGLVIELINTAIEFTVDLMTQEYKLFAKLAKDIAAAAMLLYALGAVALALQIFLPKILNIWPFI